MIEGSGLDRVPVALTANIVAAYISKNRISPADLQSLIVAVYTALKQGGPSPTNPAASQRPAVPISRSVFADHLICLEDGSRRTVLTRHLLTAHGMSPDEYRAKWDLPQHYSMTATSYRQQRSQQAVRTGFGRRNTAPPQEKAEGQDTGTAPDENPNRSINPEFANAIQEAEKHAPSVEVGVDC